jgi:hypothetical protein
MRGMSGFTLSGRRGWKISEGGEYYRVCCPYCNDTRFRLWINHRWGVGVESNFGEIIRDKLWWAAICYNEACLERRENREDLRSRVWSYIGPGVRHVAPTRGSTGELPKQDVPWPGQCVSLGELSNDHVARRYLLRRGFAPDSIADDYGAQFCCKADPQFLPATGRIIFPVIMNGIRVAWQGRVPDDLDWKASRTAKYYTMPGAAKRRMLYGFDAAVSLPFCIVVEGVTDVCALGAGAIGLLGKSMSDPQLELICANWKYVLLMLDPDAASESSETLSRLRGRRPVAEVRLSRNSDPAQAMQLDPTYVWDLIYNAAAGIGAVA